MALDMSAIKQKREDLQKGGGYNADFDKLEKGDNVRRILPPKGDKKVFWAEGYLHFGLGDDGKVAVTCLDTFDDGEPCPICAYVEELKKSRSKEDKKLADNIKKTKRTYLAVLNRDDEEETPKVLSVGKQILQPIIDLICDPDYGDITDFEEGTDITIKKSGTGMNTEYSVVAKRKSSVAWDGTEEELQESLPDLDALFVRKSVEELQAILNGEDYDSDDDEDDDKEETAEAADGDYDDLSLEELEELCEERDIKVPPRKTKIKLIALLEAADEEEEAERAAKKKAAAKPTTKKAASKPAKKKEPEPEENEEDDEPEESGDEDDDVMSDIQAAVNRRKKNK